MIGRFALVLSACVVPVSAVAAGAQSSTPKISPAAAKLLVGEGALLVDVREPNEIAAEGSLPGSLNLPLSRLTAAVEANAALGLPVGKPIVLYCKSGARAAKAAALLTGAGHKIVYNLGGYSTAAPVFGTDEPGSR